MSKTYSQWIVPFTVGIFALGMLIGFSINAVIRPPSLPSPTAVIEYLNFDEGDRGSNEKWVSSVATSYRIFSPTSSYEDYHVVFYIVDDIHDDYYFMGSARANEGDPINDVAWGIEFEFDGRFKFQEVAIDEELGRATINIIRHRVCAFIVTDMNLSIERPSNFLAFRCEHIS